MDIGDNGGDLSGGFGDEAPKQPRTLPEDLPKSLDDRKNVSSHYAPETEMYDPWQGQSQFLTTPALAKPLQFNNLSLDDEGFDDDMTTQKLGDSDTRLMEMLAAQAAHRDGSASQDEDSVASDEKLSESEKKDTLQRLLNMAASNGDVDRIERILGASTDIKSSSGRTAFDFVAPDSDISDYLHDHGYGNQIGSVGVTDDFYNPGFSQDRFEEEMAENELRRRMMMESARDLEVDLGNMGIDDQPESPAELEEEAQEFDWSRCLHDQMFVFQESELSRILDIVITNMTPQRSPSQKPVPANILFLSARYAHYHANQDLLAKLLITAMDKINDVVETHQWDMTILAFWISNATLLLHYLKKDVGLAESTSEFQLQLAELLNEIFILIIRDAERRMDKVLDPAMLDHETIPGFEDITFQNEWKIFKRKNQVKELPAEKRFRPPSPKARAKPSPRNVTSLLSSTLFVLDLYDIHSVITAQILAQLLYWLGAELFNRIMSDRKYLARTKAMQIRMNISSLEDWSRTNNRQPEHYEHGSMTSSGEPTIESARHHLAPVIQLLQWLQCFSSLGNDDFEALVGTLQQLTRLTPQQLIHAVKHYRPEVGEKGLPKSAMKYLINLQKETQLRKEQQRSRRRESGMSGVPTTPTRNMSNGQIPDTPDSSGKSGPSDMLPGDEDDAPEHLLLDPSLMLPFSLPTSTDMLVSYGAGFGGLNRERERKYIPTVPAEFLAKLDLGGGRAQSTYGERDWENEEV
ncbi:DIL domain-containing protein [Diplocarpon rosae]|nr:DIL domain-containing protein [Diplocarpon rosae]